ncbi:hypothetical protein C6P44_000730 [Monosporozyma unispora]|nr:hypothetical protein C6P44_000730 [Kazachstania unispora]
MPVASHNGVEQYSASGNIQIDVTTSFVSTSSISVYSASPVATSSNIINDINSVIIKPSSSFVYPGYRYSNQTTKSTEYYNPTTTFHGLSTKEYPTKSKASTYNTKNSAAIAEATINAQLQAQQQQEVSSTIANQKPAITTSNSNSQVNELSDGNGINTKIAVQSVMSNAPSTTFRISIQQNVNGASQNKLYGPLFSIFLLITSMYI